jgi:diguanylate cyclase (GGDEF)-like protein
MSESSELELLREENRRLRQQVEELSITDKLTGMSNRRAMQRALETQVTRSRRYHNPLSIVVVEVAIDGPTTEPEDEVILAVSRFLCERLRWVDIISRWEEHQFVLVLPETGIEDGQRLLHKIRQGFGESALSEQSSDSHILLYVGLAEWQKGDDVRLLLQRAMEALAGEKSAAT